MNDDLKQVLEQIDWAEGRSNQCSPFTPTEQEEKLAWAKLKGYLNLTWGCKLLIYWKEDVSFCKEENSEDWKRWCSPDEGILIALPGHQNDVSDGVVWCSEMNGDHGDHGGVWQVLTVLLSNPMVEFVEAVK